jgi:hypothetical protein
VIAKPSGTTFRSLGDKKKRTISGAGEQAGLVASGLTLSEKITKHTEFIGGALLGSD